jgi:hypothetical protein
VRLLLLRYTTATRLDMYSTTHRCVEWPCFTEAKSVPPSRDYTEERGNKGRERGRERTFRRKCRSPGRHRAIIEGSASDGRRARGRGPRKVPVETASWAPIALTVLGDQAVVTRRGEEAPLNGYFLTSAPYLCPFRMHAREK